MLQCLFSAKGACSFEPGATAQGIHQFPKEALKARIISRTMIKVVPEVNRAFSANEFFFN
jgi:hypothetical protein